MFSIRKAVLFATVAVLSSTAAFSSTTSFVTYDATAPTGFGQPATTADDRVKYQVTFGSDSTYIFGTITALPAGFGNDKWDTGFTFANLYLGTGATYNQGSDFGIEVTNNRAFIPGGNGYTALSSPNYSSSTALGSSYAQGGGGTSISFQLSWAYLMTDPDNMGFSKVSVTNPNVMFRGSQSYSYSFAYGSGFGPDRFGVETKSFSTATPEPATWGLFAGGLTILAAIRRRTQKAK